MDHNKIDIDQLLAGVELPEIARGYISDLKRRGREHVGCCPFHSEKTGSFTIYRQGGRDRFYCFGCGAKGDAIDFLKAAEGIETGEAIKRLGGEIEVSEEARRRIAARRAADDRKAEQAKAMRAASAIETWKAARPIAGTIVETYLREARGIDLDRLIDGLPPSLRFAPDAFHAETKTTWPAMIGAIQAADRRIVAAHITYLEKDGSRKADISPAKRMIGPAYGGAVRFAPAGYSIGIAEGIETALSIAAAAPGKVPMWAALSLQNIAGAGIGRGDRRSPDDPKFDGTRKNRLPARVPDMDRPGIVLPDVIKEVYIFGDNDGKDAPAGAALIDRAAARWTKTGRRVHVLIPPPGMDFNDLLQIGGMP